MVAFEWLKNMLVGKVLFLNGTLYKQIFWSYIKSFISLSLTTFIAASSSHSS